MSPILKAFLKAGWIQVGDGIPVFFKHNPTDVKYPFFFIFTEDSYAYFELYDEWIETGKIKEEQLDTEYIQGLVNSAFDHSYATNETFHTLIIDAIHCHYKYNSFGKTKEHSQKDRDAAMEYDKIACYLIDKKQKEKNGNTL